MRKKYIDKITRDLRRGGGNQGTARLSDLANKIGLSYSQLYRIIKGISKGTIDSWEKIILFYTKK